MVIACFSHSWGQRVQVWSLGIARLVYFYNSVTVIFDIFPVKILPALKVNGSNHARVAGDMEQERYFFSNKEAKYPKGNRVNRASSSGFWKATGLDKQIISSSKSALPPRLNQKYCRSFLRPGISSIWINKILKFPLYNTWIFWLAQVIPRIFRPQPFCKQW